MKLLLILTLACGFAVTDAQEKVKQWRKMSTDGKSGAMMDEDDLEVVTCNFTQKLDHFNPASRSTFTQRYMYNFNLFRPGGPIFLLLEGQHPVDQKSVTREYGGDWMKNAGRFGAKSLVLEHRYYGESRPFENYTVENLKWLSIPQAVADAAYFIISITKEYQLGISKWIVFGCGYGGDLAAWLRLKYPHLVAGAVASSPSLAPKVNFWENTDTVRIVLESYNVTCVETIANATRTIEDMIKAGEELDELAQMFSAEDFCNLSDPLSASTFFLQLFLLVADVVQNGGINQPPYAEDVTVPIFCNILDSDEFGDTALERYALGIQYLLQWKRNPELTCNYEGVIQKLRSTDETEDQSDRLSYYQSCTEMGMFPVADVHGISLFSKTFGIGFFYDMCRNGFGNEYGAARVTAGVQLTNQDFQGKKLTATKVIVLNGSNDPVHRISITNSTHSGLITVFMPGFGRCADTFAERTNESMVLVQAREKIRVAIADWLR